MADVAPDATPELELERAIARARTMVIGRQSDDGSWQERGDMGPFTTALSTVALHRVGRLTAVRRAAACRWLRVRQLADGSFPGRPFADAGDLGTTAAAWAALSLSDVEADALAANRARSFVAGRGGVDAVAALASGGDVSGVLLAVVGLAAPATLTTMPLSVVLVPRLVELLSRRIVFYGLTTMLSSSLIVRGLVGATSRRSFVRDLLGGHETTRALELLTLYQNGNGSLMNVVYHTALLVLALHGAGVPVTDPRLAKAIDWLEARGRDEPDGLCFDVYGSDVWSTASYLRVLLATGSSRSDVTVTRAVAWLLREQCSSPHPALTNPAPGAPRVGGWGFQSGEERYPDCDTTSTVLDALGRALVPDGDDDDPLPAALATRVCASIATARAWLGAMQNADGGWPSFFRGHPTKRPGPIMMRPMALDFAELARSEPSVWVRTIAEAAEHLADPSTEDVTSRVLLGLSRTGTVLASAPVAAALDFLATQQCPSGAWWGRWKVNYLPVTAAVLSALARLGDDLGKDATRRAIAWTLGCQNEDGGFGETVDSYRDPRLAGRGPSTAPLTGSVLLGLVDAGEADHAACEHAVRYLLRHQGPDGAWPNGDCVATLVPPDLFYEYGGAPRYIPLEALGRYREARRAARRASPLVSIGAPRPA